MRLGSPERSVSIDTVSWTGADEPEIRREKCAQQNRCLALLARIKSANFFLALLSFVGNSLYFSYMSSTNQLAGTLKLASSAFGNGTPIPTVFTCKGSGFSPPLEISGVPQGTASLAIIMHDPDAVGKDFTHWLVWNIPASTSAIGQAKLPVGAKEGLNDASRTDYFGPCPPAGSGVHNYQFDLYALDISPLGNSQTKRADLETMMQGHILDRTVLSGQFGNN